MNVYKSLHISELLYKGSKLVAMIESSKKVMAFGCEVAAVCNTEG